MNANLYIPCRAIAEKSTSKTNKIRKTGKVIAMIKNHTYKVLRATRTEYTNNTNTEPRTKVTVNN
jgi:hypothetical protein